MMLFVNYYLYSLYIVEPPCTSSPCQHDAPCRDLDNYEFRCDCSNTNYKGLQCDIGIIDILQVPILTVDVTFKYLRITAYPDQELHLHITPSNTELTVTPTDVLFYPEYPIALLTVTASETGIYYLSFTTSGEDSDTFEVPNPMLVLVRSYTEHTQYQYFDEMDQPIGILSPGCCSPGGQIYQCPYSTNTVHFQSTCSWEASENMEHTSTGLIFASSAGLQLPLSIAGAALNITPDDIISFTLPHSPVLNCTDCSGHNSSCHYYDFTQKDVVDLVQSHSLGKTYLKYSEHLLPDWLTFMITNINPSMQTSFSSLHVTTSLIFGEDIEIVDSCEDLQVHHDALYAILRYNDSIITSIDNIEYEYTPHDVPLCFAIDLCAGESSPVHVTIPLGSQTILRNFTQFQVDKFLYKHFLDYNQVLMSAVLQHS